MNICVSNRQENTDFYCELGKSVLSASFSEDVLFHDVNECNDNVNAYLSCASPLSNSRKMKSEINPNSSATLDIPRIHSSFSDRSCSSTNSALMDCVLNATHVGYPLLGTPNTCGFWSPLRRSQSRSSSSGSESCPLFSPMLATTAYEKPCCGLLQDLVGVRSRLDLMSAEIRNMRTRTKYYASSLKKLVSRTDKLLQVATNYRRDLEDVSYLEQIVQVLDGNLQGVQLHKWPFRMLRPLSHEEIDLIV